MRKLNKLKNYRVRNEVSESDIIGIKHEELKPIKGGRMNLRGLLDQRGTKWVAVEKGRKKGYGLLDDLIAQKPSDFYKSLAKHDIIISDYTTKRKISAGVESATFAEKVYAVDRAGWHGSVYVWPGRDLPAQVAGLPVIDARCAGVPDWKTKGSYKEWQRGVRRLANRQKLPTFVLSCAFAAIVLRLLPEIEDNVGFELFGNSSIGKSKLMLLAASVYDGCDFVKTWSTTVNGLEETMAKHGDSLLILDEANLFLDGSRVKEQEMGHAVFKLAQGTDKARFNGPCEQRDHRFLFLSTANRSIAEVVKGRDLRTAQAIQTRMPTIPADAGSGHGIFDNLPKECRDDADAIVQINQLADEHHGWAALAFISRLEKEMSDPDSREAIFKRLKSFIDIFVRRCRISGNDGEAQRVARKFGLVCAAGRLARRWRVLPLDDVGLAGRTVFERYRHGLVGSPHRVGASAIEQVRDYITRHRGKLHDLDGSKYPDLTDVEFDHAAGFLRSDGGSLYIHVPPKRWAFEFGSRSKRLLDELSSLSLLWATEGNQRQVRARLSKPKDRVYCIKID